MTNNIIPFTDEAGFDFVLIDRGNGEFTSMPKSVYDEMIAAQNEAAPK